MVEILDGFGSHLSGVYANEERAKHKILSIKEEGDASTINQAYDRDAAKSDKRVQRLSVTYLQHDPVLKRNIVSQWDLLCCGLAAVRHTRDNPDIWAGSFLSVDLTPSKRSPFKDWCKRIERFMMAGDGYDLVSQNDYAFDEYTLLPERWQAMTEEEKTSAVNIVKKYNHNAWGLECCRELMHCLKVRLTDIPTFQPAIFLAIDNPSHLSRGLVNEAPKQTEEQAEAAITIAEVEANRKKANHGLDMLVARPPGMKGIELFDHMISHRQRLFAQKEKEHKISDWLEVWPRTPHQISLMDVDYHLKMQGSLIDDLDQGVGLRKAAQVRLDNLGQIKNRSMFINDPTRLARLKARLELQRSLGRRNEIEKMEEMEDLEHEKARLGEKLADALVLFNNGHKAKRAFTKDNIAAILLVVFGTVTKKSVSKKVLLQMLEKQVELQPQTMIDAMNKYCDSPNEIQPAAMPSSLAGWLYLTCLRATTAMDTHLSPIRLATLVLKTIEGIPEDEEDVNRKARILLQVELGKVEENTNKDFIMDVAEKAKEMLDDEGVSEEALMECEARNRDGV